MWPMNRNCVQYSMSVGCGFTTKPAQERRQHAHAQVAYWVNMGSYPPRRHPTRTTVIPLKVCAAVLELLHLGEERPKMYGRELPSGVHSSRPGELNNNVTRMHATCPSTNATHSFSTTTPLWYKSSLPSRSPYFSLDKGASTDHTLSSSSAVGSGAQGWQQ